MLASDLSYFLIAAAFVCVVNIIAFVGLFRGYSNSRKKYLGLACVAVVVETLRQIPDTFLAIYPESSPFYFVSFGLQFSASLILLCALLRSKRELQKRDGALIGFLVIAYTGSVIVQAIAGLPQSVLGWYLLSAPSILAAAAIAWSIIAGATSATTGRALLTLGSLALVLLRLWIPAISSIELLYLVYYMEVLIFPFMLIALNLAEIETMYKKVDALLQERTQSQQDMQFILDNTLDVTLIVNNVGLLRSWNKRAEFLFGYNETQSIGKVHIDELFSSNYWHKNAGETSEFEATMENMDGRTFPVRVRLKTVHRDDKTYSIYVLNRQAEFQQNSAVVS